MQTDGCDCAVKKKTIGQQFNHLWP